MTPLRAPAALVLLASVACQPADPLPDAGQRDTATAMAASPQAQSCLVDSASIAGVRLGMTLDEVRRTLPTAELVRQEDGDGAMWVSVTMDTVRLAMLHAGEEDTPIEWTRPVTVIETFHPGCRTADGLHPGSLVTDVERIWGRATEIVMSEIESRQYITFERQPAWLTVRLDYTGIFADGSRRTTQYKDGARLFSLSINGERRDAAELPD